MLPHLISPAVDVFAEINTLPDYLQGCWHVHAGEGLFVVEVALPGGKRLEVGYGTAPIFRLQYAHLSVTPDGPMLDISGRFINEDKTHNLGIIASLAEAEYQNHLHNFLETAKETGSQIHGAETHEQDDAALTSWLTDSQDAHTKGDANVVE